MPSAPVQVVLEADSFRRDREIHRGGSAGKDFFEGRDADFKLHQQKLYSQVSDVSQELKRRKSSDGIGDVGYVAVTMRHSAVAKSHRPIDALLPAHITPMAGGRRLGEMIAEVNADSLEYVNEAIGKAEETVRRRVDKKTGELIPAPSRYRCEVGAIERIQLWGKADRRRFDIQQAIKWLSRPETGHVYLVELFENLPNPTELDLLEDRKRLLFKSFTDGLRRLGPGLVVRSRVLMPDDAVFIEVALRKSAEPAIVTVQSRSTPSPLGQAAFDTNEARHRALVGFLESHPLVREVFLPNILVRSATSTARRSADRKRAALPVPKADSLYPMVGVIDGGIAKEQSPWIIYKHSFLSSDHAELTHGSFIGGLLVAARSMNPSLVCDPDGCLMADIDIFPDSDKAGVFERYFPDGIGGFFDELSMAVEICKSQHGIRVYNLSINVQAQVAVDRYSLEARRLDKIAEDHDVIFVISAGNLDPGKMRQEWPQDDLAAASVLAAHRDDQLYIPAESARNLSVAAVNPEGLTTCIGGAPARYSRRGPGLRAGIKPDMCHVGGAGSPCPMNQTGLFSRATTGTPISGCGTSYAAPLVAKTLASVAAQIEGEPSRETLMALTIHSASIPVAVGKKAFDTLAPQLVGFGQPAPAQAALEQADSQITLLFSSRIFDRKTLEFRFAWPPSLVVGDGKCKGDVRLTLVSTPPLDHRFGEEVVRVNIEAALQQETADGKFKSELESTYVFFTEEDQATEVNLIEHKMKWAPVKSYATRMKNGRGKSSNWRLVVNYLTRAGELMPNNGVPFSILLTIRDPDNTKPIFQEMRQALQASGIKLADIRTATRVTARV